MRGREAERVSLNSNRTDDFTGGEVRDIMHNSFSSGLSIRHQRSRLSPTNAGVRWATVVGSPVVCFAVRSLVEIYGDHKREISGPHNSCIRDLAGTMQPMQTLS